MDESEKDKQRKGFPQMVDKKKQIFVGTRIPKHWVDEAEDNEYLRLASAPLIVPEDVDAHYYSKVV